MISPEMINAVPVKKYTDVQVENCRLKVEFIKNRLIVDDMDDEYRFMISGILDDYQCKLHQMEHAFEWIPLCEKIY